MFLCVLEQATSPNEMLLTRTFIHSLTHSFSNFGIFTLAYTNIYNIFQRRQQMEIVEDENGAQWVSESRSG